MRRFTYRVDGFVALRGGAEGGQLTTKPLRYEGERLLLNYLTRPGGKIKVDVLDEAGKVIGTSKPLSGDKVDAAVAWQQPPGLSQGVVQLKFTIENANVYSLRFD